MLFPLSVFNNSNQIKMSYHSIGRITLDSDALDPNGNNNCISLLFLGYTFDFAPSNNRKEDASRTKLNRILSQKLQTAADVYEKQLKTKKS